MINLSVRLNLQQSNARDVLHPTFCGEFYINKYRYLGSSIQMPSPIDVIYWQIKYVLQTYVSRMSK